MKNLSRYPSSKTWKMYARSKHSPKKFSGTKTKDVGNVGMGNSVKHKEIKPAEPSSVIEDKELTLPTLKMVDSEKYLQCYRTSELKLANSNFHIRIFYETQIISFSVLSRLREEGIGMEDLDKLQMELEMMLSNVVLRQRIIHAEIAQISVAEETKSKKTASLSLAKLVSKLQTTLKTLTV